MEYLYIGVLLGKTLKSVVHNKKEDILIFTDDTGKSWQLFHEQDCCEYVYLADIVGELDNLVGFPVLLAEQTTNDEEDGDGHKCFNKSCTWTFYKLATIKGYVTLRWIGESNGYYSEGVSFVEVSPEDS